VRHLFIIFFVLVSSTGSVFASEHEKFPSFLWQFFNKPAFQLTRIVFPIEFQLLDSDSSGMDLILITKQKVKSDWKHMPGPEHYRCEKDCFDFVIYDNHEQKFSETSERLLAYEGVENGINVRLYFILKKGKWFLIRIENEST